MSADPIFQMITAAKGAHQAHGAAIDAAREEAEVAGEASPEAATSRRRVDTMREFDEDRRWQVIRTAPATPAGMLAYVDFFQSGEGFGDDAPGEAHMDAVLGAVRSLAASLIVGPEVETIEVIDKLAEVRHLLEALFMMANSIGDIDQTNAFQRVTEVAHKTLADAVTMLEESEPEGDAE